MSRLPKGSSLKLVKTKGLNPGTYDLYNLIGLSLGKLHAIKLCLETGLQDRLISGGSTEIIRELLGTLKSLDNHQTVDGH